MTEPDLSALYQDTHARLAALVAELDDTELTTQVPACPGWSVQDVVAHLLAITQDSLAGRLTGIPSDDITAAQVARFRGHDIQDMLAAWEQTARPFGDRLAAARIWPGVIDIAAHEQDIRGAIGRPGARDNDVIRLGAGWMLSFLDPPVPMRLLVEDAEFRAGPSRAGPSRAGPSEADSGRADSGRADSSEAGHGALTLKTSRFEAFRWRLGRRSRAQLAALDWSGDPTPVLDHLVIFGPASSDIIE